MSDFDLKIYIEKQFYLSAELLEQHVIDIQGELYSRRYLFDDIYKHINNFIERKSENRYIIIPGLRGVGKTTLLAQLFFELEVTHGHIKKLYLSLDELMNITDTNLHKVLEAIEAVLGSRFSKLTEPLFVFFDEIQSDPKWALTLKSLYDKSKNIFVICTGSSAIELQQNADTARRALTYKLYPLSFIEYQNIKNKIYSKVPSLDSFRAQLKQALFFSDTAKDVYEFIKKHEKIKHQVWSNIDPLDLDDYLSIRSLPFALKLVDKFQVYNSVNEVLSKIIYQDLKSIQTFDLNTLNTVKKLLYILAGTSDSPSLNKLSEALNIDRLVVMNLLDALEKTEILIKAKPYGSNMTSVKKSSKYLFTSPTIRMSLLNITGSENLASVNKGRLLEDLFALYVFKEFINKGLSTLSYDARDASADFILQLADKKQIAVELGYGVKESKQLIYTMKKIKCDYGLLISSSKLFYDAEFNIVRVPLEYFLLI